MSHRTTGAELAEGGVPPGPSQWLRASELGRGTGPAPRVGGGADAAGPWRGERVACGLAGARGGAVSAGEARFASSEAAGGGRSAQASVAGLAPHPGLYCASH